MIPIDSFEKWSPRLDAAAGFFLSQAERQRYLAMPDAERSAQLRALLEKPIARFTPVNEAYFRAKWADALKTIHPGGPLTLLEVASGDADMIPQMMARAYPYSRYITANMNRLLTESLRAKTRNLPVDVVVIEDDAAAMDSHLPAESVDVVAFQHAVNDVIQAILCDQEGVDTVTTDWMGVLPAMIRILQQEVARGTLEQRAKPAFLALLQKLLGVLKENGVMVMSHYMFQLDLDWGYPPDLWENFIPITREWICELPGCREVFFEGFDPHWWMFYQKTAA